MDILIKNMELPTNCFTCFFSEVSNDFGKLVCLRLGKDCGNKILEDCPLIELPPHGRLIDADELLASDAIDWGEEAWNGINHAPTVLEAST